MPALTIRMHANDNVAIVATDGGLPAGTVLPEGVAGAGITLREPLPQGHKLALQDIAEGAAVRRYGVTIGYALAPIAAGSWVHERRPRMPLARALHDLPLAPGHPPPLRPRPHSRRRWGARAPAANALGPRAARPAAGHGARAAARAPDRLHLRGLP